MKWFRKQTAPAGASVQLRETGYHPFGLLGQYVPMRSGEIRLYRAVREAVPVVDAARSRLDGGSMGSMPFWRATWTLC